MKSASDLSMTTRISETYDAFIAAGAPTDKAIRAAEAIANSETRLSRIDGDPKVLKHMLGFVLAGVGGLVLKAFF
jgi:hypothetical protein